MTAVEHAALGTELQVQRPTETLAAKVVEKPFFDPRKTIATGARGA
jgi:aminomethyltransferase